MFLKQYFYLSVSNYLCNNIIQEVKKVCKTSQVQKMCIKQIKEKEKHRTGYAHFSKIFSRECSRDTMASRISAVPEGSQG